ncbi:MAG: PhoPQ-activated protein PqaA family protein [Thermoproteota archaeon]
MRILIPKKVERPEVLLMVMGSGDGTEELNLCKELSRLTRMVVTILHDIPNQSLFDNLYEDALMAYSFAMYLKTKEFDWPLLFPMVKSVVKAMDVLESFLKGAIDLTIKSFIVTGASKRGWTTWLTSAVDWRVSGIAPMVYDNLNLPAQMKHQIECYGAYSEQISDYTKLGLQEKLDSKNGKTLVEAIDPYSYRDKLRIPKLIVNGTNDRFWTVDSLNLYFDDLLGQKYVLYVPNSGHALEDRRRVINSLAAFSLSVSERLPMPDIRTKYSESSGIVVEMSEKPLYVDLWIATSSDMDFRDSRWISEPIERLEQNKYFHILNIGKGLKAFFVESCFNKDRISYTLSSPMYVSRG